VRRGLGGGARHGRAHPIAHTAHRVVFQAASRAGVEPVSWVDCPSAVPSVVAPCAALVAHTRRFDRALEGDDVRSMGECARVMAAFGREAALVAVSRAFSSLL
jgi:hypothetical protein